MEQETESTVQNRTKILTKEYVEAELRLCKQLDTLENAGKPCNCKGDLETIDTPYDDQVIRRCLKCGGDIDL